MVRKKQATGKRNSQGRVKDWKRPPPEPKEWTEEERGELKAELTRIAVTRGGIQQRVMEEMISLAFNGTHLNGDNASRSARTEALKRLYSEVPEELLKKEAGVAQEGTVLQINFALDAVSTDPRVKQAELVDIFDPEEIPTMTEALPSPDSADEG